MVSETCGSPDSREDYSRVSTTVMSEEYECFKIPLVESFVKLNVDASVVSMSSSVGLMGVVVVMGNRCFGLQQEVLGSKLCCWTSLWLGLKVSRRSFVKLIVGTKHHHLRDRGAELGTTLKTLHELLNRD
ncbi:hypothetical protein RJT34_30023 [Clitoria ternatea]|uniref:Uncharacterized protein n=1 Tax=Clitoria ternatea TaxID=43366 RepID=A0AAN9I3P0_CLITE